MRLPMRRKQYLVGNRFRNLGHRVKVACQESRLHPIKERFAVAAVWETAAWLQRIVHRTRSPVNGSVATVFDGQL